VRLGKRFGAVLSDQENQALRTHSIVEPEHKGEKLNKFTPTGMLMASPGVMPESPLDVLSRAATMVESGHTSPVSSDMEVSPPRTSPDSGPASRNPSFKELHHPKFRKHSTPEYLAHADQIRSSKLQRQSSLSSGHTSPPVSPPLSYRPLPEPRLSLPEPHLSLHHSSVLDDAPLDFSIRKREASPSPPPPYKYSNPLRQHSPPHSSPHPPPHLPITPAPSYTSYANTGPPPYPRTPSPHDIRPPPPSYEAAIASHNRSPSRPTLPTTSPTFITLHPRPSPNQSSGYKAPTLASIKVEPAPVARPSVICSAPSVRTQQDSCKPLLVTKHDNKENKEASLRPNTTREQPREITIVEENGALGSIEDHFRKALGDDYSKLFQNTESKKLEKEENPAENSTPKEVDPVKAFNEDLDTGYTVEDHFAKALGETWIKLQAEADKKEKTGSSNQTCSSVSENKQLLAL